jgi:hypothetical protein
MRARARADLNGGLRARAKAVYSTIGFLQEGTMRGALRMSNGSRHDLLLISLLRDQWQANIGSHNLRS